VNALPSVEYDDDEAPELVLEEALTVALRLLFEADHPDAMAAYQVLHNEREALRRRALAQRKEFCSNPSCGQALSPEQLRCGRRTKYCNHRCRQQAYVARKKAPYFCPRCGWHPCRCSAPVAPLAAALRRCET
jgi:hypothetical protein